MHFLPPLHLVKAANNAPLKIDFVTSIGGALGAMCELYLSWLGIKVVALITGSHRYTIIRERERNKMLLGSPYAATPQVTHHVSHHRHL
jgi:hypothetical protein